MFRTVSLKNDLCIFLLIMVSSCSGKQEPLPYYNTPDFTPLFINNNDEATKRIAHTIGNFSLTDHTGAIVSEKDIEGKVHIANFIFTSCASICRPMTNNLAKAGEYFKKNSDVVFLSFSVTPWKDDPPALDSFRRSHNINNPNWHFLTGKKEEIYRLARTSYFAEEDIGFTKDSSEFLHTEHILLVDSKKRLRGIYNGTLKLDIDQLIQDVQQLLSQEEK